MQEISAGDTSELTAIIYKPNGERALPADIVSVNFTVRDPAGTSITAGGTIQPDGSAFLRYTDTEQLGTYTWAARFNLTSGEIRSFTDEFVVVDLMTVDSEDARAQRITDVATIKPTTAQVAASLPGRVTENGVAVNDFTADTTPSVTKVTNLIDVTAGEIFGRCESMPMKAGDLGRQVVKLSVAIQIERGYFPQEQDNDSSILADLQSDFNAKVIRLEAASRLAWASKLP